MKMKKVLRYVSIIALVLFIGVGIAIGANSASAASKKTVTIHVKNSVNWKKVCVYTYDGDGELAGSWPGKAMKKNKLNKGWVDYTFKTSSELNLVFNNGSKRGAQTNDIKHVKNNKKEYWITITGGSKAKNDMGVSVSGKAKLLKKKPASFKKKK